jgi:hypothetical protein
LTYKPLGLKSFWIATVIIVISSFPVFSQQDADTTLIIGPKSLPISDTENVTDIVYDTLENRPNTASWYSAALPGLGQAYNNKFWKIPIIYGGGLVVGYYINYNNRLYKQYRDGLYALIDQDDRTQPFNPNIGENDYRRATDYWRRNRDLLFIAALALYAVNIVDAHVDAHLALFNIDEDISMKLDPYIDQTAMQTNLYGISIKIRLN